MCRNVLYLPSSQQPKLAFSNRASTDNEKEKGKEYEQFLSEFLNKHGRLPVAADEDVSMIDFEGFMPRLRRFWNRIHN